MGYERNVKILTWQGFFIGFLLWAPIAAIYFSKVSGSYALGLSIFSIVMVSSVIFEVPTGVFSDLIGRKWTTAAGGLFYMLAGIFYAVGINYWFLVVGAVCEGCARAFYSGNNDALLYDSLEGTNKKQELAKFMGFIGSAEQWALAIAALTGGILAAFYSFELVMWSSVLPLFLCFVTSFWLVEVPNKVEGKVNIFGHIKEAWGNFVANKKLRMLSLSEIIGYGISESGFQFRSVFVASVWPAWAIGISQMLSNIGAAISFGLSGRILKKIGAIQMLLLDKVLSKVVNFWGLVFPSAASPAIMASVSVLYGPSEVAQRVLLQREFSDQQRATMGSLNSLAKNLFFGVVAIGMGLLADKTSPRIALIWGQIFGLLAVWLTWKLYREGRDTGK